MTAQCLINKAAFLGNFGPPAITFARSCRAMGVLPYLIASPSGKRTSPLQISCFSGFHALSQSGFGTSRGIEELLKFVSESGVEALTSLSDDHCLWLARNADRIAASCKLMLPSLKCLELVESKLRQIEVANQVGLRVLPTVLLRSLEDVNRVHSGEFPVCLRPSVGNSVSPSFKVLVVTSQSELRSFLSGIKEFGEGIVAQPFRRLPNALIHCTSNERGDLLNCKGFLVDRKFEGLALRIRPLIVPEQLVSRIAAFSKALRLSGSYHYDFLTSPSSGEWFFLEVNARFGGTTEKVVWFGVDEPANCLAAYGLGTPRPPRLYRSRNGPVVNKRATIKHIVTLIRHRPDPADYPSTSRLHGMAASIGDLFLAKDSIADMRDIRGTVAFHLAGALRRIGA